MTKEYDKMPDLSDIDIAALQLELHKNRWAVRIRGGLYVFPVETTRAEAEEVIRRAAVLNDTRHN